MPKRSLSIATTALWCRYLPVGVRTVNEMIESRSAFLLPKISMLGWPSQAESARCR